MTLTLSEIASLVGGQLHGSADLCCSGANPPAEATESEITMLDHPQHGNRVHASAAAAVVTAATIPGLTKPQIIVSDPHAAFAKIVTHFRPPITCDHLDYDSLGVPSVDRSARIDPRAVLAGGTFIGARTRLLPGAVVMPGCRIGDDCVIHPGVVLYPYTQIGDRVVIHASSVLGANGFGYRQQDGRHIPTAQLGYVAIEDDVEIGAGVTIDRGTYGATRIGAGTKIDNQVQIGHNCRIGRHNLLCSQVGIAGSCTTGDYVVMAGQVGLADHLCIGDQAVLGAQAGIMEDLEGHQVYLGSPATTRREQMQIMAVQRRLPELRRELRQLRRELASLQSQQSGASQRAA